MNWFKKSMFSNQRFLLWFCGQGISYFGDSIAAVAIPILVLTYTQSAFLMGLVGALEVVPVFVIGLVAGVWVDRWSRKKVMLVSDFGRALVMGLIPAASLAHAPMMPVVVVVAIVSGTLAVFFGAAYTGLIRRVVGEGELGRANGYFEAIESIAYGLGPLFAGVLTSKIGASYTIGIDALSFLFSAISILGLRSVDKRSTPGSKTTAGFFLEMKVGVQTVLKDSVLSAVNLLWGSNRFVFAALIPALTFFVLKTLHGDSFQVGVAVSLYAVGSLIGTLIGSRIPTHLGMAVGMGAQLCMFVGAVFLSIAASIDIVFGCVAMLGVGEGLLLVIYLTYRVGRVPEEVVGRVYAVTSTATLGMGGIGYLVVGSLLNIWGSHVTWMVLAALSIMGAVSSYVISKQNRAAHR